MKIVDAKDAIDTLMVVAKLSCNEVHLDLDFLKKLYDVR